ncbi:hypothetical protein AQUCO_03900154v1 [Aquilegia coerulea]|uniref:F-box domain-containing protein n=1 Tax=Aquilegia coerulea TaxID=218851 RepID=A0A2G5CRZ5_AQUCA|nr:hypothetical protein AQUCO_03900154v1 [Aquilegia coerulea]
MKSSANKKKLNKGGEDRISALPHALIHYILSFLEIREVLQTSFISRKWRYIWKSHPVLNFDYDVWNYHSKKKPNGLRYVRKDFTKAKCLNFVDRVLLFRDNSSPIQKINFTKPYTCDSLRGCFSQQENMLSCKGLILPDSLFTSGIEVLKLKADQYTSYQLPGLICSAHKLRTLDLKYIKLPNGKHNDEFVFNYPVLENLILEQCDFEHIGNLRVNAFAEGAAQSIL